MAAKKICNRSRLGTVSRFVTRSGAVESLRNEVRLVPAECSSIVSAFRKPKAVYVEYSEDQLTLIPPAPNGESTPSAKQRVKSAPKEK